MCFCVVVFWGGGGLVWVFRRGGLRVEVVVGGRTAMELGAGGRWGWVGRIQTVLGHLCSLLCAVNSLPFCCVCESLCTFSGFELSCHSSGIGVGVRLEKKGLKT